MHSQQPRWWQRLRWTHRDTVWLLVLVVGALILVLSFKFKDSSEVTGLFSFAGTLVSVILGVLAIFYSTVQGSDSNQIIGEMRTKLDQVSADTQMLRTTLHLTPELRNNGLSDAGASSFSSSHGGVESAFELMRRVLRRSVEGTPSGSIGMVTRRQLIETAVRSDTSLKDALTGFDALVDAGILRQNVIYSFAPGADDFWEVDVSRLRTSTSS